MAATVQELVDQVRDMTMTRNNNVVSDDEIARYLSDAVKVLVDIFLADDAHAHWFFSTFRFSLAGGVGGNSVALPSNLQVDLGLNLNPDSPNPITVDRLSTFAERNNLPNWGNYSANANVPGAKTNRKYVLTGDQLQVLPPLSSQGDYELFYQAQIPDLAVPHVRTFAVNPADIVSFDDDGFILENADFDPARDTGAILTINWNSPNDNYNGNWVITGIHPGSTTWCFVGTVSHVGFTNPVTGADYIETYQPPGTIAVLPQVLNPWQLFLKAHASIAVNAKRDLQNPDIEKKLDQEHARAVQMSQVRVSNLKQGPITRRDHGFMGGILDGC